MNDRKRKAFIVDNMCTGYSNFDKRLRHDNIEIRFKIYIPEEKEKIKRR